jgi:hypothetical protein
MRLIHIFEARFQEIVHENPSVATLKALARNNKYHSARFVITKSGDVYAADSVKFTYFSMAPFDGAWEVRGYVIYSADGEFTYRSMAPFSSLNKDHPIFRIWERAHIRNDNPDQSDGILHEYLYGVPAPVPIPPRHPLLMPYVNFTEAWSAKYKRSINCEDPKGFSQRAHCAGRKRRARHKERSHVVSESAPHSTHKMIDNQKGWGAVPDNQNVDYLGMRVLMGAGTFLSLASPLSRQAASSAENIRRHLESGHTVGSPWMTIRIPPEWSDGDFSEPARVISHEGRNRMWAIQELVGNTPVEVHVFFAGGLRARHIQPEWINQINQQLIPQGGTQPIEGAFFDTLIKEGAPGTLKAKITRTYGGAVTCDKARRLKSRSGATTHDKRQANWFLNMNCGGASRLDEIFTEPAQHNSWKKYGTMYETRFKFDDKQVIIELISLTGAQSQRVFDFVHMDQEISPQAQGYELIFRVDTHTSITGELGTRAGKLLVQVVSVIRGFLESHDWDFLIFSAEGESRLNLYEALARRIADQHHMSYAHRLGHFVIHKLDQLQEDAAGVGLVVPGVNMPTGQHADEIRRQARKWGFKVSAQGVPPTARTDGKLTEGKQTPCIVVDVQPEYSGVNDGAENPVFEHIIQFVNRQTGHVLMFVNAEDQGLTGDTVQDVKSYWEDSGFDPDNWHRVTIVDKGYGYLRSWMDQGIPARAMIKTIRTMYAQKVSDSRELFGGEDSDSYEPGFKQLLGSDYDPIMLDDPIYVNWISVAQLKRFEGSFMMGGGRDECLREVELIMNAFNIHFKRVNDLVYG